MLELNNCKAKGPISVNYMELPLKNMHRLQLAQNAVPGVVLGIRRMAHVTPLLRELHWLPVCLWVQLKVLVISFKALHVMDPGYLKNHLIPLGLACPTSAGRGGMLWAPSA